MYTLHRSEKKTIVVIVKKGRGYLLCAEKPTKVYDFVNLPHQNTIKLITATAMDTLNNI